MPNYNSFYIEAIRNLFAKNPRASYDDVLNAQVELCYARLVTKNDENLIRIAFDKSLTQAKLDAFLQSWDIEVAGGNKALLLSYVMGERPDLDFGSYTGPRLKGLIQYNRFANLNLIAKYTRIVRELNAHGIEPIIVKGGAMKYVRPQLMRTMGDIDILVANRAQYETAKKVVREIGFDYDEQGHSIDLHEKGREAGVLDIHLYLDLVSKYDYASFNARLFAAGKVETIFNTRTVMPCDEDLYFISLINMARNLRDKTSVSGILFTFFDLEFLKSRKKDFDWNRVAENIAMTQTGSQVLLARAFLAKLLGARWTGWGEHEKEPSAQKALWRTRCREDIFYSLYVYGYKCECKKLRVGESLKSWASFKRYVAMKVPHFFTKRIFKHPALVQLFLKWKHGL